MILFKETRDLNDLATLYQRYMDMVYAVCLKYLKDREESKDAVMEIFQRLSDKLLKHDVSNFRSWLYVTAKNHCLMQLRSASQKNFSNEFDEDFMYLEESGHPEQADDTEFQVGRMKKCIETLTSGQKECVTLFYLHDKCYKEIAAVTGMEWNKVRSLIQNGKRNLKICMEKKSARPLEIPTANKKTNEREQ